jgi:hypothetical protein
MDPDVCPEEEFWEDLLKSKKPNFAIITDPDKPLIAKRFLAKALDSNLYSRRDYKFIEFEPKGHATPKFKVYRDLKSWGSLYVNMRPSWMWSFDFFFEYNEEGKVKITNNLSTGSLNSISDKKTREYILANIYWIVHALGDVDALNRHPCNWFRAWNLKEKTRQRIEQDFES